MEERVFPGALVWKVSCLDTDPRIFGKLASRLLFSFTTSFSQLVDPVAGAGGPGSRFKGKHSLDSDEEDDDEEGSSKYDILASEDVEGELFPKLAVVVGTGQSVERGGIPV